MNPLCEQCIEKRITLSNSALNHIQSFELFLFSTAERASLLFGNFSRLVGLIYCSAPFHSAKGWHVLLQWGAKIAVVGRHIAYYKLQSCACLQSRSCQCNGSWVMHSDCTHSHEKGHGTVWKNSQLTLSLLQQLLVTVSKRNCQWDRDRLCESDKKWQVTMRQSLQWNVDDHLWTWWNPPWKNRPLTWKTSILECRLWTLLFKTQCKQTTSRSDSWVVLHWGFHCTGRIPGQNSNTCRWLAVAPATST